MKTIVVTVSTGYQGSQAEVEFKVDDTTTEDEIHKMALDAMFEMIDWGWYEKGSEDGSDE